MRLLVFCVSSLRSCELVCSVRLWHFLIILTYCSQCGTIVQLQLTCGRPCHDTQQMEINYMKYNTNPQLIFELFLWCRRLVLSADDHCKQCGRGPFYGVNIPSLACKTVTNATVMIGVIHELFLASAAFCHLLITFANRLDTDLDIQRP